MTEIHFDSPLVSAQWLKTNWGRKGLKIVDATYMLPFLNPEKSGEQLFEDCHIPDAVFFSLDEIADGSSDLPHMLPNPIHFSAEMSALGISNDDAIVVYDQNNWIASARVWWTFRVMGHTNVAVLNGGLQAWKDVNGGFETGPIRKPHSGVYQANLNASLVANLEEMRAHVTKQNKQIIDARNSARFLGEAAEPRAGLKSGHMPGAFNLPHSALLRDDGHFQDSETIIDVLTEIGLDLNQPIVTTCGSGVTASILALGLAVIGREEVAVYDGSWSEWGGTEYCPVHTKADLES